MSETPYQQSASRKKLREERQALLLSNDLTTIDQAAAIMGCSPVTVRRLIRQGKLETIYTGRLKRIIKASIAAYQQQTRSGGPSA